MVFVWIRWAWCFCNCTNHHGWFIMVSWLKLLCNGAQESSCKGGSKGYSSEVYVAWQEKILSATLRLWQQSKCYSLSYFEGLEKVSKVDIQKENLHMVLISEPTGTGKPVEVGRNSHVYGNGTPEPHSVEPVLFVRSSVSCSVHLFRGILSIPWTKFPSLSHTSATLGTLPQF